MMTFFNRLGESIVAKIILGVLALSMIAFWGLGGLSNARSANNTAIKVGSHKITPEQLLRRFEQERQNMMGMMGGQYLSPQKAFEMGLAAEVAQKEIARIVNAEIQDDLGLIASNAAVQKYVERNPAFADALGQFDKNLFYAYLGKMRMNEATLAKELQAQLATQHLTNSIQAIAYRPDILARLVYQYQGEKRDITALVVEADKIKITEKPTEAALKDIYESYADEFIAPEYRTVNIIRITPEAMLDKITIDETAVNAAFEAQKEAFITPEKRAIDQMRFEDEATAKAAMTALTGNNFQQVAQERLNQSAAQTDFGFVSKDELLEELATPVFSAKKGDIVGPIQSPMGWHIMRVRDIQAAVQPNEAEIKAKIRAQLAGEKTYDVMYDMVKKAEDILGAGDTLDRVSTQLGLKIEKLTDVDITGQTKTGNAVPEALNHKEMMQNLFTLKKGEITPIFENGTGYIVAEVLDITPVAAKPFDSVKSDLIRIWTENEQANKVADIKTALLERTQNGAGLEAQSVFGNFRLIHEKAATRAAFGDLPIEALNTVFSQKTGKKNAAATDIQKGVLITVVNSITVPEIQENNTEIEAFKKEITQMIGAELIQDTTTDYANNLGISVNDKVVEQAFSVYMKNAE